MNNCYKLPKVFFLFFGQNVFKTPSSMTYDKRLFDYLYDQLREHPIERAFGQKIQGQWQYFSTAEMVSLVNRTSKGLLDMGLRPGDKVATVVYQPNRNGWC